jgi:hypothetical protein
LIGLSAPDHRPTVDEPIAILDRRGPVRSQEHRPVEIHEPAKLSDQEKWVIGIARKAVSQCDDWADRAEFKIERKKSEWHVTARRVESPEANGNLRYLPWGRREIIIDDAGKVVSYSNSR